MKNIKNRFPFFDFLLTILTIILLGTGAYLIFLYTGDSSANSSIPKDVDDIASTIDEVDSNFTGIKIITEISNDPNTPFAIQYPQSKHIAFNDKVKKYIKRLKYDYLMNIADYEQDHKNFTSEFNISFETFQHPNGLYSFVVVNHESIDEQNGKTNIRTFHLNPETGDMPTIAEVVKTEEEPLKILSNVAASFLAENNTTDHALSDEEISLLTASNLENFNEFAFTNEMLILYFTQIETDEVIPIVSIPYSDVNHLLALDFQLSRNDLVKKENESSEQQNNKDTNEKEKSDSDENDEKEIPNAKRVALTFDDGPDPAVTMRILETLEKYDAKATFFMLGSRVEFYPEIAKNVQEAGHELGNHSWTHPDLSKASTEKIFNEINRTSSIIEEVTGEKPYSFRPPYGAFNDVVMQQTDLPVALWDVDTLDWKHRNGQQLLASIKNHVKDGSIILMHDIHPSTADGLDAAMAYLQENGFIFVPVSDLLE